MSRPANPDSDAPHRVTRPVRRRALAGLVTVAGGFGTCSGNGAAPMIDRASRQRPTIAMPVPILSAEKTSRHMQRRSVVSAGMLALAGALPPFGQSSVPDANWTTGVEGKRGAERVDL